MSKELIDKLRNGNIQETYYYVKYPWSEGEVDISYVHNGVDDWIEIVNPVPSYTDLCELKQELEICKDEKADLYAKLCNALMQLEEANKVIKFYSDATGLTEEERQMSVEKYHLVYGLKACDYLERYGVK